MLPLRVTRTRLGRELTRSRPILRVQSRGFSSGKSSSSASTFSKTTRYIGVTSVAAGASYLRWSSSNSTSDQVPRLETPPTEHLVIEPGPSKDEVTRILSQEAYSFQVKGIAGVSRYDGAQLASLSPCEDQFIHGKFSSPRGDGNWMAWGIFDGAGGRQTSELLEKQLLPFVRHSLRQAITSATTYRAVSDEAIQHAIQRAFVNLDDSIINTAADIFQSQEPPKDKLRKLVPAYASSCALLSVYDPVTNNLHVACTGNSRAVLGQKINGKWKAIPLSVDQTSDNKDEVARLIREHPGEENVAKFSGFGDVVLRAFGDAASKWPLELQYQDYVQRLYGTPHPERNRNYLTPPYSTAEPVVTTTKIDLSKPSFLIMASDGLWFSLSNQQAVDLVGKWIELPKTQEKNNKLPGPTCAPFEPSQFLQGVRPMSVESMTTIQDDNVAVHLIRNALGGNAHELIAGRLAINPPLCWRTRDDITVQVAFFDPLTSEKLGGN